MAQKLSEIMTRDVRTVSEGDTIRDAAAVMRDEDIGDVLVVGQDGQLRGIVTDRDIVLRAVAEGRDAQSTRVADVCSSEVTTCAPDHDVADAVRVMREQAIRRLPVVEQGKPVGIVSIGDLAIERDPESALADISAAPADE